MYLLEKSSRVFRKVTLPPSVWAADCAVNTAACRMVNAASNFEVNWQTFENFVRTSLVASTLARLATLVVTSLLTRRFLPETLRVEFEAMLNCRLSADDVEFTRLRPW